MTAAKQLAGAFYGMSGIPKDWRDKLALKGLIESMAEELFDMSNRVDPCPPPLSPPPTASKPPAASVVQPSSGAASPAGGAQLTDPSEDRVTRFMVKPAVESQEGGAESNHSGDGTYASGTVEYMGMGGDAEGGGSRGEFGSAYWVGGVAAHYQHLEDEYM